MESGALAAGIGPAEFWEMTPREVWLRCQAEARRQERERERDTWLAWHIAAMVRLKRLPRLGSLLEQPEPVDMERKRREHAEIVARLGN